MNKITKALLEYIEPGGPDDFEQRAEQAWLSIPAKRRAELVTIYAASLSKSAKYDLLCEIDLAAFEDLHGYDFAKKIHDTAEQWLVNNLTDFLPHTTNED